MLDLKLIHTQKEILQKKLLTKGCDISLAEIINLDNQRKTLVLQLDELRTKRNQANDKIAKAPQEEKQKIISQIKETSAKIKEQEVKLKPIEEQLNSLLLQLPNPPLDDVPEGKNETQNIIEKKWGTPAKLPEPILNHIEIGKKYNIIDIDRAAKVSGARFYYLKNEAVLLEFALINLCLKLLQPDNFIPLIPPVLATEETITAMGYLPTADTEMYQTTLDKLRLVATSEQTIGPLHKDEILNEGDLPLRYVGFSTCFRREAGSYGKDVRGILRVHQFDKLEMFIFCKPQDSEKEQQLILSLQEKIMQTLNLPYQVVKMCTGDLGVPAAKKYDIETWIPSQKTYRETHSCSNCTDFQARRLNIRYRDEKGKPQFVHTLNGTAIAIGRMLIALLENNQNKSLKDILKLVENL